MFRTIKYHYKCNSSYEKRLLMFLFHISKNLYNVTLYTLRQQYFNNEKISSYFELNKLLNSNENFHLLNTYASICTFSSIGTDFASRSKFSDVMHFLKRHDFFQVFSQELCHIKPIHI